jgi:hypothetical protein
MTSASIPLGLVPALEELDYLLDLGAAQADRLRYGKLVARLGGDQPARFVDRARLLDRGALYPQCRSDVELRGR